MLTSRLPAPSTVVAAISGAGSRRSGRPSTRPRAAGGTWPRLAALGFLLFVAGNCSQPDTVLSIRVTGNVTGIQLLKATVLLGDRTRSLSVPAVPRPISLPTSFTVQIDRSVQGPLNVTIYALDGAEVMIARGEAALAGLSVGRTNEIAVALVPVAGSPGSDAGAADGVGAGDGGGDAGGGDAASGDV